MPTNIVSEMVGMNQQRFITVSEMARQVGLSRARFYELMESGVFPQPTYCVRTRRPMYDARLQQACINVKTTCVGANGSPVLFYRRRAA